MTREVTVEIHDATIVIALDRPAQRNAVNRQVSKAIAEAVDRLDNDDSLRVGILTGVGGHFCSGMDLKAFADGQRPELEGRGFGGITERPPKKPFIAAVEGYALAGGLELALACDLIIAGESAVFGLPEVKRGLVAGSGGLVRLPRRIPQAIALQYSLTGEPMTASIAERWGLVNRIVPDGDALNAALALALVIAENAPISVTTSKQIVYESAAWAQHALWDIQRSMVDAVLATEDAQEGAHAFAEKRSPVWSGR